MRLLDALHRLASLGRGNIGEAAEKATDDTALPPAGHTEPEPIDISPQYQSIRRELQHGTPIVFVSGGAGTGKTTLIHWLRSELKANIVVAAPTGVAALNARGVTLNALFRFPRHLIGDADIELVTSHLYTHLNLLVIDEISMVRADMMDGVDRFLRKNGPHRHRAFGGVQLLLVGDLFQLPPVVNMADRQALAHMGYRGEFFFNAQCLQGPDIDMANVELSTVYRQHAAEFVNMLNHVRLAENLQQVIPEINRVCYRPLQEGEVAVTLTCHRARADRRNRDELALLPGSPRTYVATAFGRFAVEEDSLPSPRELTLKPGAQVMFTKNDVGRRWVNGTLGRVVSACDDTVCVQLGGDSGPSYEVQKAKWESYRYEYVDGKIRPVVSGRYEQYPLILAWAVTIHKSQGKTLDRVRIDLGPGAFAAGQVYVALSRCRSLDDISLARNIALQDVRCDERVKRFYFALAEQRGHAGPATEQEG